MRLGLYIDSVSKMLRILFLFLSFWTGIHGDTFKEELLIQPLANNDLMASFNFVTLSPFAKSRQHFDLMPRYLILMKLLQKE